MKFVKLIKRILSFLLCVVIGFLIAHISLYFKFMTTTAKPTEFAKILSSIGGIVLGIIVWAEFTFHIDK